MKLTLIIGTGRDRVEAPFASLTLSISANEVFSHNSSSMLEAQLALFHRSFPDVKDPIKSASCLCFQHILYYQVM